MSGWVLRLQSQPALRVDARTLQPAALATMSTAEIEQLALPMGNTTVPLAELFALAPSTDDALHIEGDASRLDFLGWQMSTGRLVVHGPAGDYAGGAMRGGELVIEGSVRDLAACEMAGGTLVIDGDAGDFVASTLPGSMDGMRGGFVRIRGGVGARCADRMRRGTVVIDGDAGDFLASRLVAGTIALAGRCGAHPGFGMRRGSLVFVGPAPAAIPPAFVPAGADAPVFWQLLARDLQRHGGVFAGLAGRHISRHLGDVTVDGKGEWILPA